MLYNPCYFSIFLKKKAANIKCIQSTENYFPPNFQWTISRKKAHGPFFTSLVVPLFIYIFLYYKQSF